MDTYQGKSPIDDRSSYQVNNNEIVPTVLTCATVTNLDQLNDDCLLEIFSSNCLTTLDLCSLAETCTRFKRVTQDVFPKEFKIVVGPICGYYTREYKFQSKKCSGSHKCVQDVVRILTNFGSHLSTLAMHGYDPIVTNLVAEHCDGGSLKRIEIFALEILKDLSVEFKKIFQQLLTLSFDGVHTDHLRFVTNLQLNCDSLLELEVLHVDCCSAILQNTFPKLERFSFKQADHKVGDTLLEFIGRHKCLRVLEYTGSWINFRDDFASAIGNGCKGLEELTLKSCQNQETLDLSKLHSLTELRMLHLEILDGNNQLATLLPALKSLEILKISNMVVEADAVDALSEMQHLRELHLVDSTIHSMSWPMLPRVTKLRLINHTFTTSEFLHIISQLTNLKELEIYSWDTKFVLKKKIVFENWQNC